MTGPMTMEQQEYFVYGQAYSLGFTMCYLKMWTEISFNDLYMTKMAVYNAWGFSEDNVPKRFSRISSAGFDEGVDVFSGGSEFHECHILKNKT